MPDSTNCRWFECVQFKIGSVLVILVSLVMGCFGVYGAAVTSEKLDTELDQLLDQVGGRASSALALALWEFNQEQGVDAIVAEMADKRVEGLALVDSYGEVFAARVRNSVDEVVEPEAAQLATIVAEIQGDAIAGADSAETVRSLTREVFHDTEVIGTLLITVNEEQLATALQDYYVERIWQTVILVVITVGVLLITLQYRLISPLRSLTAAAGKLSLGDLQVEFTAKSNDEVGQLARALQVFQENAVEKQRLQEQSEIEQQEKKAQEQKAIELANQRQAAEEQLKLEQSEAAARELERSRTLQVRVDKLLANVDSVAAGHLLTPICVKGDDAIGRIGERLEHVFHQFAESIKYVVGHAGTLSDASGSLSNVSESIAQSAQKNSAQAIEVSQAADEISGGVDNVAAAITQMTATVKQIASNAEQATGVAVEATHLTTEASCLVGKLSDSSADIGNVIKVITSIAEQTNLLALNATIEAARAGDAGKGFAVVANEVKELAKETASATDDISRRIQTIQSDSGSVTDSIAQVSSIIDRINELQSTIAVSVDEQALASSEISRIVARTATGSQIIASSMNEIADGASASLSGANTARKASMEMGDVASELKVVVAQFRIDDKTLPEVPKAS